MIIIVGCNKGGSGKTTIATNLSVALAMKHKTVCLVDADRQKSVARWHRDREEGGYKPSITLVQKLDNIAQELVTLEKKFNHTIVDVAGRNSKEMITGLAVADILLAPHQASQLDLDTLNELQKQVKRVRDINPKLKVIVHHTMASTNPSVKNTEHNEFLEYVSQFDELIPMKAIIYYRKVYKDVIPSGQSVLEYGNKSAINEINLLVEELL